MKILEPRNISFLNFDFSQGSLACVATFYNSNNHYYACTFNSKLVLHLNFPNNMARLSMYAMFIQIGYNC